MIGSYIERLGAGEDISRPSRGGDRRARPGHRRAPLPALAEVTASLRQRPSSLLAPSSPLSKATTSTSSTGSARSSGTRCREFGALLGRARVPRGRGGCLLSPPRGGALRRSRSFGCSWSTRRRRGRAGPRLLAADRGQAEVDLRRDVSMGSPVGPGPGSRDHHRSGDDHALGYHDRAHRGVADVFRRPHGRHQPGLRPPRAWSRAVHG